MSLDNYIKSADYKHKCPLCNIDLIVFDGRTYEVSYKCPRCNIKGATIANKEPFTQYHISVLEKIEISGKTYDQIIIEETFYIHFRDNQWYSVSNNLVNQKTNIVLIEPASSENLSFLGENASGLVWMSDLISIPFVYNWDLSNQEKTLSKIRTYLVFS